MGRPILGASKSRFVFLVDSLIAGVRKTQEDTLKVFVLSNNSACKANKDMGEIECEQRQTQHISIYPSGD